jgi:hypothetical protein
MFMKKIWLIAVTALMSAMVYPAFPQDINALKDIDIKIISAIITGGTQTFKAAFGGLGGGIQWNNVKYKPQDFKDGKNFGVIEFEIANNSAEPIRLNYKEGSVLLSNGDVRYYIRDIVVRINNTEKDLWESGYGGPFSEAFGEAGALYINSGETRSVKTLLVITEEEIQSATIQFGNLNPILLDFEQESLEEFLPPFTVELKGSNVARIVNPNDFHLVAGLRLDSGGVNLAIPAHATRFVYVPDGRYDIYFVYSYEPKSLYQGDSFVLANNGIEIQIVRVAGGNYGIRKVN